MKLAVFAFTTKGCRLAERVKSVLSAEETRMVTMEKFGLPDFEAYTPPLVSCMKEYFSWADLLVFIGSTGMAVRAIAPWVKSKVTDPAVLCIDEGGSFVISLLSGHIGGANDYAKMLASAIGAVPVVTTATDVEGKFSPDGWAAKIGCAISSMHLCKKVSAAILEGEIPLSCDFPMAGTPAGTVLHGEGALGIHIGCTKRQPYAETLHLIPKILNLGIGCRRGIGEEKIAAAVDAVCEKFGIFPQAIAGVYSIDLKKDEPGLLSFCAHRGLKPHFYTPQELENAPGAYPKSEFVRSVTGVDNVCQRAAMLGAETLIVPKTAMDGVTVSIAQRPWEAVF